MPGDVISNLPMDLMLSLRQQYGLVYFVESGTARGDTSRQAAAHFRRVYTIEIQPRTFARSRRWLYDLNNVTQYLGNSGWVLEEVIKQLDGPALFWLDGHYGSNDPFYSRYVNAGECPLLSELAALRRMPLGSVILIDDARLFMPGRLLKRREHKPGDWPTVQQIADAVHPLTITLLQQDMLMVL